MGILSGVMRGVGEGLSDMGQQYMQQGMQEQADNRRFEQNKTLQQMAAQIDIEREKAAAQIKLDLAGKLRSQQADFARQGVASVVDPQFDQAADAYKDSFTIDDQGNHVPIDQGQAQAGVEAARQEAINQGLQDPDTLQKGYLSQGDVESARVLEGMGSDVTNVPLGSTMVDKKTGKVIYDGSAILKKQMEADKQAAQIASRRGGVGGYSHKDRAEAEKQVDEATDREVKGTHDPYGDPADDPDGKKVDETYARAVRGTAQAIVMKTPGVTGYEATAVASRYAKALDGLVRQYIEVRKAQVFDEDGKARPDAIEQLKGKGIDASNPQAFAKSIRDQLLTDDATALYAQNPDAVTKKYRDLMAAHQKPPEVVDNKPGIIDKVKNKFLDAASHPANYNNTHGPNF